MIYTLHTVQGLILIHFVHLREEKKKTIIQQLIFILSKKYKKMEIFLQLYKNVLVQLVHKITHKMMYRD